MSYFRLMIKCRFLLLFISNILFAQDTLKISYVATDASDEFIYEHFFIDRKNLHDILFIQNKKSNSFTEIKKPLSLTAELANNNKFNLNVLVEQFYKFRDQFQKTKNFKYYSYNFLDNILIDDNSIKFELNKKFKHLKIDEKVINKSNVNYYQADRLKSFKIDGQNSYKLQAYRNEIDILSNLSKSNIDFFQYTEIPKFIDLRQKQFVRKYRQYEILRDDNSWFSLFFNDKKLNTFIRQKLKKSINRNFLNKKFSSYNSELSSSIFRTDVEKYFSRESIVYDPLEVIKSLKKKKLKPLRFIYPVHSELIAYVAGEITIQLAEVGILVEQLAVSLPEYLYRLESKQYEIALVNLFYENSDHIELLNLMNHYLKFGKAFNKYLRTLEQIDDASQIPIIHKLQDLIHKSDKVLPLFFSSKMKFMITRSYRRVFQSIPFSESRYTQQLRHISEWMKNE